MNNLVLVAVVPGVLLLIYIYAKDPVEKEPLGLLLKLLLLGAISALPAAILETAADGLIPALAPAGTLAYLLAENLIGVALIEEGCKLVFLVLGSWGNPAFDYRFDAIVYAVFVSLGFAILENLLYVFNYGFETGLIRAVTAVPGHAIYGVFMGYFFGLAKARSMEGRGAEAAAYKICTIAVPVIAHGLYDFLCSSPFDGSDYAFLAFLVFLYVAAWRIVKSESGKAVRLSRYRSYTA